MFFRNMACLATLVLSFPLVVPDVCSADYTGSGSGNEKVFSGEEVHNKVIMGQAINSNKASSNSATFKSSVNVQSEALGGEATYQLSGTGIAVEADSNTITFETGSSFKSAEGVSEARSVYGGKVSIGDDTTVSVSGTFKANENTVDIQSGAVFGLAGKITIVGGSASNEGVGNCEIYSQQNTVTIKGSSFEGSADAPLEFELISAGVSLANNGKAVAGSSEYSEVDTGQGNTLTITSLKNAVIDKISVAEASSAGGNAYAIYNNGTLQFGDNVLAKAVYGAYAKGSTENVAHTAVIHNSLSLLGGHAELVIGGYAEGSKAEARYSTGSVSKVNATDASSDNFKVGKTEFYGGKAVAVAGGGSASAYGSSFTIEESRFTNIYGGQAVSKNSSSVKAYENSLILTDVTVSRHPVYDEAGTLKEYNGGCLYGGYASSTTVATTSEDGSITEVPSGDATVNGNTLYVSGGTIENNVYGGYARTANKEAQACYNYLYMNYKNDDDGNLTPETAKEITINGALYGGYAEGSTAKAFNNTGMLLNVQYNDFANTSFVTEKDGDFAGGKAVAVSDNGSASVYRNIFAIEGSSFINVYGGQAVSENNSSVDAYENSLTLTDVTVSRHPVYDEENGTVEKYYGGCLYGGYASSTTVETGNDDSGIEVSSGDATVNTNTLYVSGGTFQNNVYSGYAKSSNSVANSYDNYLYINYKKDDDDNLTPETAKETVINGALYGGYAEGSTAKTTNNTGKLLNVQYNDFVNNSFIAETDGDFAGGKAVASTSDGEATATYNSFTIEKGSFNRLYGGQAVSEYSSSKVTAEYNQLVLTDVNCNYRTYGDEYADGCLYGGYASNAVTAASGTDAGTGTGDVAARENKLYLSGGTYQNSIYGGYARSGKSSAEASNNYVYVNYDLSSDGYLTFSEPSDSEITVNGVYGGYAEGSTADASGNTIYMYATTGSEIIYGGKAAGSGEATVINNTLDLYGGSYHGYIYGGYAEATQGSAWAKDNEINLRLAGNNSPNFNGNAVLCGGYASTYSNSSAITSGNSLNFYEVKNMTARNIENFSLLYYEYQQMQAGEHILTLTGGQATSIPDATVVISLVSLSGEDGTGEFKAGDEVVLLENANTIDIGGKYNDPMQISGVTGVTGVSLEYDDLVLKQTEDKTKIILTRLKDETEGGESGGTKVNPGTKAIAEGAAAGLALVNESANAVIGLLHDFSLIEGSITPFVHVQASSMRHETGSSINVNAVSLITGLGTGIGTGAGHLSAAAFFEYGKGSYTTHNSFDSRPDIDGDGNAWYMGGGILAKMEFEKTGPGHFYLDGSAHMGTLHNEYDSNDLIHKRTGQVARFDMDSPYYSLYGGIGYIWNITEDHDLDIYGKYVWSRVQGTDDTLTTSDKFEFDDLDSNRVRLGVRYTYKGSERFKPYVGAAFEHEFSGSCESRAFGYNVAAPSFEGSSGMGELGLMMKPSEDIPLSVNLGVQGYAGRKQGVSGDCNIMYEF